MNILRDLTRAKATFQARTLRTILTEGMDMTDQSRPDQMSYPRALVERVRGTMARPDKPNVIAMHVGDAAMLCDALTAALDEIERLRSALRFYAWENETKLPSEGPWGVNSTDFGKLAREALKGQTNE